MTLYALGDQHVATPPAGDFWVAPSASVIGQVTLGAGVSVWFNAVIRGDNEPITIGANSNLQEGCVLHVDPGFPLSIAENCTIGHMAMLHGCQIEDGALVGIGAIVLNGAIVGAGSLIGAGALVPEGKVIPPRSLVVGTPGKVIRQVTDEEAKRIRDGAASYCRRWRHYAEALCAEAAGGPPRLQ